MKSKNDKAKMEEFRIKTKREFEEKTTDIIEKAKLAVLLENENKILKLQIAKLEEEICNYKEWNDRLLEYMDLTDDQLKAVKEKLSITKSFDDVAQTMAQAMGCFGFRL